MAANGEGLGAARSGQITGWEAIDNILQGLIDLQLKRASSVGTLGYISWQAVIKQDTHPSPPLSFLIHNTPSATRRAFVISDLLAETQSLQPAIYLFTHAYPFPHV